MIDNKFGVKVEDFVGEAKEKIEKESEIKMEIPLVDNGKKPNERLNVKHFIMLPSDTPYGNLLMKSVRIIYRVDELNRQIINSFTYWEEIQKQPLDLTHNFEGHLFSIEMTI